MEIDVKTAEEFVDRISKKLSVSRLLIKLCFKWNVENSKILRSADLSSANLRSAKLSFAETFWVGKLGEAL